MLAREWEVTFVCAPRSAVETRVAGKGYEVVALRSDGGVLAAALRLRRVLLDHFVEAVFVHTEREHLIAALATRFAERGAVVRRIPAGAQFRMGRAGGLARRLTTTGFLFTGDGAMRAAQPLPSWALEPAAAELGVDAAAYDEIRPIGRASVGAAGATRLIVCVFDPRGKVRLATTLRTVALLAPRHPELRLAIIGRGSDDEDLRMHAAALGITRIVSHLGEREDHLAVLRAADVGWIAADGDDAAFACLDFMALRIPVLADRAPLPQHYLADGIAGLLLPPGDTAATAATVAAFLAHEDQRVAMGNAGRVRVARDFTEAAMIDGFERATTAARDRTRWML
jgi:glycosyltransferase involved in cell wall biosynthesis